LEKEQMLIIVLAINILEVVGFSGSSGNAFAVEPKPSSILILSKESYY